jgi:hypothetical protein
MKEIDLASAGRLVYLTPHPNWASLSRILIPRCPATTSSRFPANVKQSNDVQTLSRKIISTSA